jgi:hypothetical protein
MNNASSTLIGNAGGDTLVAAAQTSYNQLLTTVLYAGSNMTATASSVKVNGSAVADTLVGNALVEMIGNSDTLLNGGLAIGNYDTIANSFINTFGSENAETLVGNSGTVIASTGDAYVVGNNDTLNGSGTVSGNDDVATGAYLYAENGNNNVLIGSGNGDVLESGTGITTLVSSGLSNYLSDYPTYPLYSDGTAIAQYGSDIYVDLSQEMAETRIDWENPYAPGYTPGDAGYEGDTLHGITIAQVSGTGNILIATTNDTLGGDGDGNTLIALNGWAKNSEAYFWTDSLSVSISGANVNYATSEVTGKEDAIVGEFARYAVSGNYDDLSADGQVDVATGNNDVISGGTTLWAGGANDILSGGQTAIATGFNDTLINDRQMYAGVGTSVLEGQINGEVLYGNSAGTAIASYGSLTENGTLSLSYAGVVVNLGNGTVSGGTYSWSEEDYVNGQTVLDHSVAANTGVDTLIGIDIAQATGVGETLIGSAGVSTLIGNGAGNTLIAGSVSTVAYFAQNDAYVTLGNGQNGEASITPAADLNSIDPFKAPGATQDVLVGIRTADVVGNEGYVVGSSLGGDLLEANGTGNTLVAQGTGNTLVGTGGAETLYGSGDDLMKITGGTGGNLLTSGGNSVLEDLGGSGVHDTLVATHNDTLIDTTGSVLLETDLENNTLIGNGQTEVDYVWLPKDVPAQVVVNLGTGIATDGNGDTDTLIGVNSALVNGGLSATLIGANGGGSFLNGTGPGTTIIAAGSENTLEGARLSTLVSSLIGGNTLIGNGRLSGGNAGVAFYSESFMTINLETGVASGYGRLNDTLIRINEAEVSGQDETLIGGTGTSTLSTTLASAMVGGSTLIAGAGMNEVLYTGNDDAVNLVTGMVTSLDSANDTLIGAFGEGGLSGKNDVMIGGTATETFIGSGTNDTFIGGSGTTTFVGELGGNTMIAGTGISAVDYDITGVIDLATDTIAGTDVGLMAGTAGSDTLVGLFTQAITQGSDSTVIGSMKGGDLLEVQGYYSTVISSGMNNVLDDYETGSATLDSGNVGGNTLIGSINSNVTQNALGLGGTVAEYTGANVTVNLATERAMAAGATDTLTGITIAEAGGAHDILTGPGTLIGGLNSDTLSGGLAEYVAAGVTVNLGTQTATNATGTASDTLVGITRALITGTNDVLIGASSGGDTLIGQQSGSDTLIGGLHGNTLEYGLAYYSNSNLDISFTVNPKTSIVTGTVTAAGAGPADTLDEISGIELTGNDDTVGAGMAVGAIYADGFGDTLIGNGTIGSDFVSDAAGNTLIAGAGADLAYETATYDGNGVSVDLAAGTAKAQGASISDKLIGFTNATVGGDHDTLSAGSVANAVLSSSGTNDTLIAGTGGGDQIDDNANGYDYFEVGTGDGAVTINNGYYGAASTTPPTDELDFGSGISDSDLWFSKSGYDLLIDVMGTNTSVDITGWFGGVGGASGDPLAKITAGGLSITNQVSQLVQAMATYSADNPGFVAASTTNMPTDTALQSVIAASWHA